MQAELEAIRQERDGFRQQCNMQKQNIDEMTKHLNSLEDDSAVKSTTSERELQKQVKSLNEKLNTQISVNKTLTSKMLIIEKSLTDEKRLRRDTERKLLDSGAPDGARMRDSHRNDLSNGYPLSGNQEDLNMMQNQLASMNQRVMQTLNR